MNLQSNPTLDENAAPRYKFLIPIMFKKLRQGLQFLVSPRGDAVNWPAALGFIAVHVTALGAFFVDIHWKRDIAIGVTCYYLRAFFLCAGFHRYFAHRTYKTSRAFQFIMALGGTAAGQRGPLWWAAHHRHHHKHTDDEFDSHSPKHGLYWSQVGWFLAKRNTPIKLELIQDFAKYPELRALDFLYPVPAIALGAMIFWIWDASAFFFGYAFFLMLSYHAASIVNSVTHTWGSRRFATRDTSRNSMLISLLTSGEGWHNNHHHYPKSCRQGFYWWEIDPSYYALKLLSAFGLVWDIQGPTQKALDSRRIDRGFPDVMMPQDDAKVLSA